MAKEKNLESVEFASRISKAESRVWGLYIPVPLDIALAYKQAGVKRLICRIDEGLEKSSSIQSRADGSKYIMLNQCETKKAGLALGAQVNVRLQPDRSKYGMPMPEELAEMLRQMVDADRYFHALSPGKQRNLIHIVAQLQRTDSRIRKALVICQYLEEHQGKLDFRELNQAFKASNQR